MSAAKIYINLGLLSLHSVADNCCERAICKYIPRLVYQPFQKF